MSAKAFYQTFYQTEQLFRRADEALTFPARYDTPHELLSPPAFDETTVIDTEVIDSEPIIITINDPVLPAAPVTVQAPVPTEPITTPPIPAEQPVVMVAPPPTEPASVPAPQPVVAPPVSSPTDTKPPVSRKPASPQIGQKVLILVDDELLPSDLLFLEKILKAVHLDIEGVDLLNVHGTSNVNFQELLSGKYIHHFFTFGVPFSRINLDILMDRYQPVRFDGITFLMADPLPAIETDVALKKKLWEALKKIFLWR
ncbi:hypothetical protein [Fibrella aquatilis]|uniref:Uncharacterized protein n=1 Tax=Fibrella aquatilis TaxID=2817059 RepID=A0A939G791_9BACT|nr:hypothetical protein [Fibrella aquatilis]MBO0933166.1 hypothetical protein [Fibrella aquatilis]